MADAFPEAIPRGRWPAYRLQPHRPHRSLGADFGNGRSVPQWCSPARQLDPASSRSIPRIGLALPPQPLHFPLRPVQFSFWNKLDTLRLVAMLGSAREFHPPYSSRNDPFCPAVSFSRLNLQGSRAGKQIQEKKLARHTADGFQVNSFDTLMAALAVEIGRLHPKLSAGARADSAASQGLCAARLCCQ
jgi:hypothetical protein